VLVAVPAYAVQRFFLHASGYLVGPAFGFAIWFLIRGEFEDASIAAAVCVACFCYFMAFRTPRDTATRRR
jgi:hypothetical protein